MTSPLVPVGKLGPALVAATGDDRWSTPSVELISGGKSNLTFLLRSGAGELVLRRPPTGELLPSAHDMSREARVQQALAGTDVPVAPVVLTDDGELIGIRCYVMEKVAGHVVRGELPIGWAPSPHDRKALAYTFADTLARLHEVDYEAAGLRDYGRPDGFMARQVRRWTGQWDATRRRNVQEVEELGRRLAAAVPSQHRATLVHGDYRLDNVICDAHNPARIRAVLDWELSTLGDPKADVALLAFFWTETGEPAMSLIPGVTHLQGFPTRREMLERYAVTSGDDLADIDWYLAFSHFKFAAILQGVQVRAAAGAMGGQDFGNLDDEIRELGHQGLKLL